ncbi:uncharacterized protein BDV14DRAFT_163404 [Aspergillus stella-maris]|uniref:uncharacterized protein n=1 Tax=Aspergillus stella-maris TaxID=1810926 RepID=UPI003CCDF282
MLQINLIQMAGVAFYVLAILFPQVATDRWQWGFSCSADPRFHPPAVCPVINLEFGI